MGIGGKEVISVEGGIVFILPGESLLKSVATNG